MVSRLGHNRGGGRRGDAWRARWAAVPALLLLAGCGAPPVEEVIPRGAVPEDDLWCGVLEAAQVEALMGDDASGGLERLRQTGALDESTGVTPRCTIVWADGKEPVELADFYMVSPPAGRDLAIKLDDTQSFLGPDGERVASGEVREVAPGTYYDAEQELLSVKQACTVGEGLPEVFNTNMYTSATESGRELTVDELAAAGTRMGQLAVATYGCTGDVSPLSPQDISELVARSGQL